MPSLYTGYIDTFVHAFYCGCTNSSINSF